MTAESWRKSCGTWAFGLSPNLFRKPVRHVHVKDVSKELAEAIRGGSTGIAMSQVALGDGVNADNIRACLKLLRDHGYDGSLSIECEGQSGPLIEKSLAWTCQTLAELGIKEQKLRAIQARSPKPAKTRARSSSPRAHVTLSV